jgi:hypothetical protein
MHPKIPNDSKLYLLQLEWIVLSVKPASQLQYLVSIPSTKLCTVMRGTQFHQCNTATGWHHSAHDCTWDAEILGAVKSRVREQSFNGEGQTQGRHEQSHAQIHSISIPVWPAAQRLQLLGHAFCTLSSSASEYKPYAEKQS